MVKSSTAVVWRLTKMGLQDVGQSHSSNLGVTLGMLSWMVSALLAVALLSHVSLFWTFQPSIAKVPLNVGPVSFPRAILPNVSGFRAQIKANFNL